MVLTESFFENLSIFYNKKQRRPIKCHLRPEGLVAKSASTSLYGGFPAISGNRLFFVQWLYQRADRTRYLGCGG